jgi:hypothetical protein
MEYGAWVGGAMKFAQPFILIALFPTLLSGKKVNPKNYTQNATVTSVSSKSKETGAVVRNDFDPCSAVAQIHRERCESQRQKSKTLTARSASYVQISGEFENMDYTAVGGCFLHPGTYKVLADGPEIRFLTKDKRGKPAECRFRIIEEREQPTKKQGGQ